MTAPTEDAAICARHRYYGRLPVPAYWATWEGTIEARDHRVCLVASDGVLGPWTEAPRITTSLDDAVGFLDHVLPGRPFAVFRRRSGRWGALIMTDGTDWCADASADASAETAARALVLAVLSVVEVDLAAGPDRTAFAEVTHNEEGKIIGVREVDDPAAGLSAGPGNEPS